MLLKNFSVKQNGAESDTAVIIKKLCLRARETPKPTLSEQPAKIVLHVGDSRKGIDLCAQRTVRANERRFGGDTLSRAPKSAFCPRARYFCSSAPLFSNSILPYGEKKVKDFISRQQFN
jgi:hypothetical protein